MLPIVQPPVLLEGTDAFLDATEQGLNHAQILERLDDEIVRATSRGMKLRSRSVSIRTALLWGVLAMAVLPSVLVGGIGVYSIGSSVRREAQSNIDRDLATVFTSYQRELARLAAALQAAGRRVEPAMADPTPVLAAIRRDLGLNVVNLSDPSGRPLDGRGADPSLRVPVDRDPVLRRALEGRGARHRRARRRAVAARGWFGAAGRAGDSGCGVRREARESFGAVLVGRQSDSRYPR